MSFADVIARKRDGQPLAPDEIDRFVTGATDGSIPDYQLAALLMAIVLRGMSDEETAWLTESMLRSGDRVDLSDLPGVKVGKHSTGGVGDKVSIALTPLAAACGVTMPKMSGRGLGHTGGTIDKLQSIPGFRVDVGIAEFKEMLAEVGAAIIGQSPRLVPADKTLYALRDVTATVESVPLISASVMSKKLAEGSDALVLDVKCGVGAFMKSAAAAGDLARSLVSIGTRVGVRTEAVVTRMDAPLGRAVGNSLEVVECIELLRGRGPHDLTELVVSLAARVVRLAKGGAGADAEAEVRAAIASGAGLRKLAAMIARQGGDAAVVDDASRLPGASRRRTITASRSGFVTTLRADLVGRASMLLGAGRQRLDDSIDHGAGILIGAAPGEEVRAGGAVLELLFNSDRELDAAETLARQAIEIADAPPAAGPQVLEVIG